LLLVRWLAPLGDGGAEEDCCSGFNCCGVRVTGLGLLKGGLGRFE
jgi:hypothetical protein